MTFIWTIMQLSTISFVRYREYLCIVDVEKVVYGSSRDRWSFVVESEDQRQVAGPAPAAAFRGSFAVPRGAIYYRGCYSAALPSPAFPFSLPSATLRGVVYTDSRLDLIRWLFFNDSNSESLIPGRTTECRDEITWRNSENSDDASWTLWSYIRLCLFCL